MKKYTDKILLIILSFLITPVFAATGTGSCGVLSEFTRPAAHIIMIIAPILFLVFSTIDFIGIVAAGNTKSMEKILDTFKKRFIILVVIMALPAIVNMIISFTTFNDLTSCF